MRKKSSKKMLGPTLQEYELVPVTDPAELEAVDRRRRAAKKAIAESEKASKGKSSSHE
jgi:hypothetical protein